jgi:RecA/RadA recombinase
VPIIPETPPGVNPILVQTLTSRVWERGARRLAGGEIRFQCPEPELHTNGDENPSARWNAQKAVWRCDVCGTGGGAIDLAVRLGLELPTETVYAIKDRAGTVVAEHVHVRRPGEKKACTWRKDDRPGLDGTPVTALPLYGVEQLATLEPGSRVVVCEGEKAASALTVRGVAAVGTVTGASTCPSDESLRDLDGFAVVLWPDADQPGREHMQQLARRLRQLGVATRAVDPWPDSDTGLDAADYTGTDDDLLALLGTAAAPELGTAGILLSEVHPERVRWLWEGRLPLEKLVLLEGRPDEGKTTLAIDLAARVSTGAAMPFETARRTPGGVVFLSAEDGLGDTIRPRFEAAGADLGRIVTAKPEDLPSLDAPGLEFILALIERVSAKLVVIDPLMGFVPDQIDTHSDHSSRRLLRKLSGLAEQTGATVLALRHPRKGSGTVAKDAGGGSTAFTAAARVVLLAASDPENDQQKILARVKGNLSSPFPAVAYRLATSGFTVKVQWLGVTGHSADQLLAQATEEERSALDEAKAAIVAILGNGPVPAAAAIHELKDVGIAERTWQRAKAALRVKSKKSSFDGEWNWTFPHTDSKTAEDVTFRQGQKDGDLGNPGDLGNDTPAAEERQKDEERQDFAPGGTGQARQPSTVDGESSSEPPPPPRKITVRI